MNFSAAVELIVSYFDMWYVVKTVEMIWFCLFKCEYLVSSCFYEGKWNVSGLWMSCICELQSWLTPQSCFLSGGVQLKSLTTEFLLCLLVNVSWSSAGRSGLGDRWAPHQAQPPQVFQPSSPSSLATTSANWIIGSDESFSLEPNRPRGGLRSPVVEKKTPWYGLLLSNKYCSTVLTAAIV